MTQFFHRYLSVVSQRSNKHWVHQEWFCGLNGTIGNCIAILVENLCTKMIYIRIRFRSHMPIYRLLRSLLEVLYRCNSADWRTGQPYRPKHQFEETGRVCYLKKKRRKLHKNKLTNLRFSYMKFIILYPTK